MTTETRLRTERRSFTLRLEDGTTREVPAYVAGGLAHYRYQGHWTVGHVASGLALGFVPSYRSARRVHAAALSLTDWTVAEPVVPRSAEAGKLCTAVDRLLDAEGGGR